MKILTASTREELDQLRSLFREYQDLLGVDLGFQGFEDELAGLPGAYAPPGGCLLLAVDGGRALGCVAVRPIDAEHCEMKRLYVRPDARGSGLGRRLAVASVEQARQLGYTRMRLDTLDRLTEAMDLYRSLGFGQTPAYYANPLVGVVYWELELRSEETP